MYRGKMERKTIVIGLGRIFGDPFGYLCDDSLASNWAYSAKVLQLCTLFPEW
jgi:hypothetical protein